MARQVCKVVISCKDVLEFLSLNFVAGHEDVVGVPVGEFPGMLILGLDMQHNAFLVLPVGLFGDFGQHVLLYGHDIIEFQDALVLSDLDEDILRL